MKALAILALIFAALAIFIPVGGIYLAMLCSIMALIAFRSLPSLAGIAFGINIINTAFLSPSIVIMDMHASGVFDPGILPVSMTTKSRSDDIYWYFVSYHLIMLSFAIIWYLARGRPTQSNEKPSF